MLREISIISHGVKIFYNHINFSSLVYMHLMKKHIHGIAIAHVANKMLTII